MIARREVRLALAPLLAALTIAGCERPPIDSMQINFRGLGAVHLGNPRTLAEQVAAKAPPAVPPAPPPAGVLARDVFQNVRVLGDLDVSDFTHLMSLMAQWVAPDVGCEYCHATADFSRDSLYTKVIARQMLEMNRHINSDWKAHVGETGVTCWTCHQGQPVPSETWWQSVPRQRSLAGGLGGQNIAAGTVNYSSLPYDPFTPYLLRDESIQIQTRSDQPYSNRASTKQTEWVYGLMMHMSQSLGVNCTFCHNSRSFFPWEASSPARATAWYGIRLARSLNVNFLEPLADDLPAGRRGPLGDAAKVNCATCHGGAYRPMYGAQMSIHFPVLYRPEWVPVEEPPATEGDAPDSAPEPPR